MFTGILIGYVVLLIAGGWMGFRKAGSKVSIVTSSVSGAILALCALEVLPASLRVAQVVLGLLLLVFILRLVKTRKFMPSGMLTGLTAITLALISFL